MSEAQQPFNALPPGHRLRECELVRVLGVGDFDITYLGTDHNLKKAVAIKEYLPSDIATRTTKHSVVPQADDVRGDFQWGLGRFVDEAQTLARFDHRHIIKVHRFFEAYGTAYVVMEYEEEYEEGETLSAYLKRQGTLSEAELKGILYPLLDGLAVVHGADLLHRDINPDNIVIRTEDGSPVLLNFGAARQVIGTKRRPLAAILTPGYAPIEQYSDLDDQGPWTDIYALGAVCYRALTGQVLANATDRSRWGRDWVFGRGVGRASYAFLSMINRALSVDKGERLQSVGAWRAALDSVGRGKLDDMAEWRTCEVPEVWLRRSTAITRFGDTALHDAAKWNASATVEVLLRHGADVQAKNDLGETPLHDAARWNAFEAAEVLLRSGAAVDAKSEDGDTALHYAARWNASATAEVLLRSGAAVDAKEKYGETPLHKAAVWDAFEAAEVLLKHGAEVHAKDSSDLMPLHYAAKWNASATAEVLLRHGADVQAKDSSGSTPLHWAAVENDEGTLRERTAVEAAFFYVYIPRSRASVRTSVMAELLLGSGAAVDAKNDAGDTPLHVAASRDAPEMAELLLGSGAAVDAQNDNGNTPLHVARFFTAGVLLGSGAAVDAKGNDGWTPLHYASVRNDSKTAELLLGSGAAVDAKDEYGRTPLHLAVEYANPSVADVLLGSGATVDAKDNDGDTPLHYVAKWKLSTYYQLTASEEKSKRVAGAAYDVEELLLRSGASVDAKNDNGETPLHYAAEYDARFTAEKLLRQGAAVNIRDRFGYTPLYVAMEYNASETARVLRRYGGRE